MKTPMNPRNSGSKSNGPSGSHLGVFLAGIGLAVAVSGANISFPTKSTAQEVWTTQPPQAVATTQANQVNVDALNKAFTDLADKMSPAVVNIYTRSGLAPQGENRRRSPRTPSPFGRDFDYFFGSPFGGGPGPNFPQEAQALGSGFVINPDGYIVTNAHVVQMAGRNADEIMVKFNNEDSDRVKGHAAKIVGVDTTTDVALLKLVEKVPNLTVAPLADSEAAKVGEWVIAIGNPYGHANTLTQGIVSAKGRSLEGARTEFIQTSASINPGNSGGPLLNLRGEVIGINTAIDPRAQGIGFAIPINTAKNVITQLMEKGRVARPYLGLAIQDMNEEIAGMMRSKSTDGVLVKQVVEGAPGSSAGIEVYDVIKKINGREVRNTQELFKSLDQTSAGATAQVEVIRNNESKVFKVRIGEQPANG